MPGAPPALAAAVVVRAGGGRWSGCLVAEPVDRAHGETEAPPLVGRVVEHLRHHADHRRGPQPLGTLGDQPPQRLVHQGQDDRVETGHAQRHLDVGDPLLLGHDVRHELGASRAPRGRAAIRPPPRRAPAAPTRHRAQRASRNTRRWRRRTEAGQTAKKRARRRPARRASGGGPARRARRPRRTTPEPTPGPRGQPPRGPGKRHHRAEVTLTGGGGEESTHHRQRATITHHGGPGRTDGSRGRCGPTSDTTNQPHQPHATERSEP